VICSNFARNVNIIYRNFQVFCVSGQAAQPASPRFVQIPEKCPYNLQKFLGFWGIGPGPITGFRGSAGTSKRSGASPKRRRVWIWGRVPACFASAGWLTVNIIHPNIIRTECSQRAPAKSEPDWRCRLAAFATQNPGVSRHFPLARP
jgi:hypothetical protein